MTLPSWETVFYIHWKNDVLLPDHMMIQCRVSKTTWNNIQITLDVIQGLKHLNKGEVKECHMLENCDLDCFGETRPVTLKLKYEIKPLSVLISFNQCYIFLFALIAFAIFCQLSRSALRDKCEFGKSVGRHCQYFFLSVRHILQVNWSAGVLMILSHPL